jgi:hypothetical protein
MTMTRIAISGHRGLSAETAALIEEGIRAALAEHSGVVGVSCLADGADQIFARVVIETGGRLEAVIPAVRYRDSLSDLAAGAYDTLLRKAGVVHRLHYAEPDPVAYMAGSVFMLDRADQLLAVWDGRPARGYGGTADVVAEARRRGMAVRVIWPVGARRQ